MIIYDKFDNIIKGIEYSEEIEQYSELFDSTLP